MKNDKLYLENIYECIENIEEYTFEGKIIFMKNRMIQDAVIRNLEIIGEATKKLSVELKNNYPKTQWRQIAGLRDVLIHDYLKVDLEEVWLIIENDLSNLKLQINQILENF